jgi:hypothetical protein
MKIFVTIVLIFCINVSFSQTIKERELDLRSFKITENWDQERDKALELLTIDKFNTVAIGFLLQRYQVANQRDSISLFFAKLIADNPNDPTPYLIRDQFSRYESLTSDSKINYLKKALEIDPSNIQANYRLGKLYYELFNQEFEKEKNKGNLDYYAKNAVLYFSDLCLIDESYKESLKYPLVQLTNYLGDNKRNKEFKNYNYQSFYFPVLPFSRLPEGWETNFSLDVLRGIERAIFVINWYSGQLKALEEPALSDSIPAKIYRFTWLRTFHNPIVIGIENINDSITLYWKVCDGMGGYEPGKIIENKKKRLSLQDWTDFTDKIDSIDFWNLPSKEDKLGGVDGAQWILEGKDFRKYHFVDRWSGDIRLGDKIGAICLGLINLTDLKIKEKEIY